MPHLIVFRALALLCGLAVCAPSLADANGHNGFATKTITGKISEWPVPTPKYPRDPAIGQDGSVYFAVHEADKIARFDPNGRVFREWAVPKGAHPQGLVVTEDGKVLYTGGGNGTIGEIDPATGIVREFKTSSVSSEPYSIARDPAGNIWFTERGVGSAGKLDRSIGRITDYPVGAGPYGLAFDHEGKVWVSRMKANVLVRLDPSTGKSLKLHLAPGSWPRRLAAGQDGALWIAYYGTGKLARLDPVAGKIVKEYELPGGPNAGPYPVNVDPQGRVWVSEFQTNNVVVFDPSNESFRVFELPGRNAGIRNAAIDAGGRYWYVGSSNGRLGVIE